MTINKIDTAGEGIFHEKMVDFGNPSGCHSFGGCMKHLFSLIWVLGLMMAGAVEASAVKWHRVVAGDTLTKISKKYGVPVAELRAANGLKGDLIRIGQMLKLQAEAAVVKTQVPVKPVAVPKAEAVTQAVTVAGLRGEDALRLQVFLDRQGFAPGKVDGAVGLFTTKAVRSWLRANPGNSEAALVQRALREVPNPLVPFTLPAGLEGWVGVLPSRLEDKARAKQLPYESMLELVAERFHTDEAALARLNPGVALGALTAGRVLKVPAVEVFKIEDWKGGAEITRVNVPGAVVRVRHAENWLEVSAGGRLLAAFPITVGRKPEHVRSGRWEVSVCSPHPTFLWDDEMLKHGRQGAVRHLLPPGPNNPVGVLWMGLRPQGGGKSHIGFHGTDNPRSIGRNQSSGCIRLANWDVVRLARIIGVGTVVVWNDESVLLAGGQR
jgi:lipoprotein-anchoring transpeptidase ErfK/SrfK